MLCQNANPNLSLGSGMSSGGFPDPGREDSNALDPVFVSCYAWKKPISRPHHAICDTSQQKFVVW